MNFFNDMLNKVNIVKCLNCGKYTQKSYYLGQFCGIDCFKQYYSMDTINKK